MKKKIKVAASILSADFTNLAKEINNCEKAGIDLIHIDVMDGRFVPNITIGPLIIKAIRPLTKLPLEAHLMIERPDMYIDDFIKAGADIITLHAECYGVLKPKSQGEYRFPKEVNNIDPERARKDIKKIKSLGVKAAMTFNPGTALCIQDLLDDLDLILIMSVNPGSSGQKFMSSVLFKIERLSKIFNKDIAVDGGINYATAKEVIKAGANILVTASYFFESKNRKEVVKRLKTIV
ncbi:MAG: ribulose-phosphate 3-epimerase [Candidatus Omnitrophica bacterium]|nr:ribulose-phosphate 3-epimerase [Candidatus Omnitrophota bacterium]